MERVVPAEDACERAIALFILVAMSSQAGRSQSSINDEKSDDFEDPSLEPAEASEPT
jgi:hypothetical protein